MTQLRSSNKEAKEAKEAKNPRKAFWMPPIHHPEAPPRLLKADSNMRLCDRLTGSPAKSQEEGQED